MPISQNDLRTSALGRFGAGDYITNKIGYEYIYQDLISLVDAINGGGGGGVTSVNGTSNRISVSPTSGAVVVDISGSYIGQSSITTLGTITTGIWNGTKVGEVYGGTNQSTYSTGDILYSSALNVLSKLSIGSDTQVLTVSGGVPIWSSITFPVTSVSGTSNRISVSPTTGNVVVDISNTYVGQSSITTLGTVTTGTWNGSTVGVGFGGTGSTSFSNGSIIFSNGTILTQKNTKLFWDNTNDRLGIGTSSPVSTLNLVGSGTGIGLTAQFQNQSGLVGFQIYDNRVILIGDDTYSIARITIRNPSSTTFAGEQVISVHNGLSGAALSQKLIVYGDGSFNSNSLNAGSVATGTATLQHNVLDFYKKSLANRSMFYAMDSDGGGVRFISVGIGTKNGETGFHTATLLNLYQITNSGKTINIEHPVEASAGTTSRESIYIDQTTSFTSTNGGTKTNTGIFINVSGADINYAMRIDGGRIKYSGRQVGNSGLISDTLYVDTAANILANGDYVVGMKA